tara:strand:- start:3258 stop:3551 length:294 start_codon:yes stop_codon:yes gene_type:complete
MIDIKLFRISTGEEIVAELVSETDETITVQNALVVLPTNNGVGFAPWATIIDPDEPEITLSKKFVVYVVKVQESVRQKYNQMFGSKLVTPEEKKLIL